MVMVQLEIIYMSWHLAADTIKKATTSCRSSWEDLGQIFI